MDSVVLLGAYTKFGGVVLYTLLPTPMSITGAPQTAPAAATNVYTAQRQRVSRRRATHLRLKRWSMTGVHWNNLLILVVVPLGGAALWLWTLPPLHISTLYLAFWSYAATTVAINILYHRYWAHQAIDFTNEGIVHMLAIMAAGGGVTHALNWCGSHRAHHRHCDTVDLDPHCIKRGLFYSHLGWMLLVRSPRTKEAIHAASQGLPNERILYWQANHYLVLFLIVGLGIPTVVAGALWDDYLGGFLYGGIAKVLMVQHSLFALNSFGHVWGTRPYNDETSARDNALLSLLSWGEGNLNFHHEFPVDYRSGPRWYSYDPTKWAIVALSALGQIHTKTKTSQATIDKSVVQRQQKILDSQRSQLNWGISIERLPVFSQQEFEKLANDSKDRYLVVISGIIHDVTPFAKDHPGGVPLMRAAHGKDATAAFEGAVYAHSNAARNLLATMRIGALGGAESIYWKQQRRENKLKPLDSDTKGSRIVRSQATRASHHPGTAGAA